MHAPFSFLRASLCACFALVTLAGACGDGDVDGGAAPAMGDVASGAPSTSPAPSGSAAPAAAPPDASATIEPPAGAVDARVMGDRVMGDAGGVTDAGTFIPLSAPRYTLRFGADRSGKNPFPGDLDRVRLYNRVITADEIAAHARRQYTPCGDDRACVGEWTFDAVTDGVFASGARAKLDAKIVGEVGLVPSPEGQAIRLNGKGWVDVALDPALDFRTRFSYEAWVYRVGVCPFANQCVLQRMIDLDPAFTLDSHAGGLRLIIKAGPFHAQPWPAADKWAHIAVTFDDSDTIRFYNNGKLLKEYRPGDKH